jgi:hypothetical protein
MEEREETKTKRKVGVGKDIKRKVCIGEKGECKK